jgi:hypothetical protein
MGSEGDFDQKFGQNIEQQDTFAPKKISISTRNIRRAICKIEGVVLHRFMARIPHPDVESRLCEGIVFFASVGHAA